jgi:hypothetical protein
MLTGEIEVEIDKLYCLNMAYNLPFFPSDKKLVSYSIMFTRVYNLLTNICLIKRSQMGQMRKLD